MKKKTVFTAIALALFLSAILPLDLHAQATYNYTQQGQTPPQAAQVVTLNPYSQNLANHTIFFDSIYMTNTNLSKGSRGDAVVTLQTFLEDNGYLMMPLGVPKGYFGDLTKTALARFQQSIGVSAVGAFGPITRATLRQMASSMGASL